MSDPQALHVTRNVIPGKLGVDLHLHRVHIPLVLIHFIYFIHQLIHFLRDYINLMPVKRIENDLLQEGYLTQTARASASVEMFPHI